MRLFKKIAIIALTLTLLVPVASVKATETTYVKEGNYIYTSKADIPTLDMYKNEDGTYSVTATDKDNNVIYEADGLVGTIDEVMSNVYSVVLNTAPYNTLGTKATCTHIPCANKIVQGGINHIINGTFCTMVTSKFYQCACCGAILGMVSGSTEIIGTHKHLFINSIK